MWASETEPQAIGTHRFLGQNSRNTRVKDRVKDKDRDQRPHERSPCLLSPNVFTF